MESPRPDTESIFYHARSKDQATARRIWPKRAARAAPAANGACCAL